MGARILWAGNQAVHAASCPCIMCRADRMRPELPTARLVPPWWVRVWSVWAVVMFLGCGAPKPEPVIFNRVEPSSVPTTIPDHYKPRRAIYWVDQCYMLNSRPFCISNWVGLRCGCCPPQMGLWVCKRMF